MSLGSARLGGGVPIRAEKKYEGSGGEGRTFCSYEMLSSPGFLLEVIGLLCPRKMHFYSYFQAL